MARRVFYSFHYKPDNWRVSQVRNIGKIEDNKPASDNAWETVTKGGEKKIKEWIDNQMSGRTCVVVMIGANTKGRKWIDYEIKKAWKDGKGLLGVNIHGLKNSAGNQGSKGANPFWGFTVGDKRLSSIVKVYDPPYASSKYVYNHIKDNLEDWIEEAIKIRNNH